MRVNVQCRLCSYIFKSQQWHFLDSLDTKLSSNKSSAVQNVCFLFFFCLQGVGWHRRIWADAFTELCWLADSYLRSDVDLNNTWNNEPLVETSEATFGFDEEVLNVHPKTCVQSVQPCGEDGPLTWLYCSEIPLCLSAAGERMTVVLTAVVQSSVHMGQIYSRSPSPTPS